MQKIDVNRVCFYSKDDLACFYELSKAEPILRRDIKASYCDINEVLELYNIKKYIDNKCTLTSWTEVEVEIFTRKSKDFGKKVGEFFSSINDSNILELYECVEYCYFESFWEIINNQQIYKNISKPNFFSLITNNPFSINFITLFENLTNHYGNEIKLFLFDNSKYAELLLTSFVEKKSATKKQIFIPKVLIDFDKEKIILNYLNSNKININYLKLIINIGNESNIRISDKTRLLAKNLLENEKKKLFNNNNAKRYGISISFLENTELLVQAHINEKNIINYTYSIDHIKNNNNKYSLFENFKILFEFIDWQNRIALFSKNSQLTLDESHLGIRAHKEYQTGKIFNINHIHSQIVLYEYSEIICQFNTNIEEIIKFIFTSSFQEKYGFATNARFNIPSQTNSYFEKVRLIAPEFESVLKQFKLFVEHGEIDFELLQISSAPTPIKDIPSLNKSKYFYLNIKNEVIVYCSELFFSDQTILTCIDPFKDKDYSTFFDLLLNELILFDSYPDNLKQRIKNLIANDFIKIDELGYLEIINIKQILLLKDLYENEFLSYYHYPDDFQKEVQQLESKGFLCFENTLFSHSEKSYFNYFLNKSEFTNGLDIRNRYVHGTQPNPHENETQGCIFFIFEIDYINYAEN